MSFVRSVTLLGMVIVVTTSCGDDRQSGLVGAWRVDDTEMISGFEFFEDGTILLEEREERVLGAYSLLDEGRLKLVFGDRTSLVEYTLDGDVLFWTKENGKQITLTRFFKDKE